MDYVRHIIKKFDHDVRCATLPTAVVVIDVIGWRRNTVSVKKSRRQVINGLSMTALALTFGRQFAYAAASNDKIVLGAILPLTGIASLVGNEDRRAMEFAVDEVNKKGGLAGHPVEFIFEDNQAKPDQSILAFNNLTSMHDTPLIFSAMSGPCLAMAPLATRKKVVLINAGAQADALTTASPYLFNTLPTVSDESNILAKYLVGQGMSKAAILFENSAAGINGRDSFIDAFPKAGGTIVASEPSQFGATDFRPPLLKLAAANPDVVLSTVTAGHLQLAQQYRQLDLKMPLAGTTLLYNTLLLADPASNGLIYTQIHIEAPADLNAAYKARFNEDMTLFGKQYYNASQMAFTAIRDLLAANKPITGENIREDIVHRKVFENLVKLTFNNNTATTQVDIKMMKDGVGVLIKSMD